MAKEKSEVKGITQSKHSHLDFDIHVPKMRPNERILLQDGNYCYIKDLNPSEIRDYTRRLEEEMLRAWSEPLKSERRKYKS